MHKKSRKPLSRKIVLRLPDLDHTKAAVLNSLSSPHSRRNYKFGTNSSTAIRFVSCVRGEAQSRAKCAHA